MNVDKWIEALQHPLVLTGFGLFLFAALIKPLFLNNEKLSGTAMERLLHKGMNFAFALALLAIAELEAECGRRRNKFYSHLGGAQIHQPRTLLNHQRAISRR